MNSKQSKKEYKYDMLKWAFIALLTVSVVFANQYFSAYSAPVKLVGWIVWLMITLAVAYHTQKGSQGLAFAKDSRQELRKVVWPTRQETTQMTLIIIVVVGIVSLLLWAVDSGLLWAVGKITQLDR
jgi:preprotein translocase subunit SecE